MSQIEYLDPSIANEGLSANNWTPGSWANDVAAGAEWQPSLEPPRINDYAAFKNHKHYGKYFQPHRYVPFPAWVYHPTKEAVLCQSKEEVEALGPEWRREPFKHKIDMTGKSLPMKSDTQRLAETIALGLEKQAPTASIDPNMIAAIVAAVMAAQAAASSPAAAAPAEEPEAEPANPSIERKAMYEMAEETGIKIDKRWNDEKLKQALGL